jgi:hypothetical protein
VLRLLKQIAHHRLAQEKILDKLAALEIRAQMLSELDREDEAAKLYR